MSKAIGYLRVSTEEQAASGLGLEAQRESIEGAAKGLGLVVASWASDEGVSGAAELEKRPGLLAAVAELGAGDVLIVAKRDRLARDPIVTAMLERMVSKQGARIVSAAGECSDGDDPASVLMRRMIDAFAEYERLIIGARTKAAMAAKMRRGECVGKVPFGFDLAGDGKTLIENQLEQRAIGFIEDQRTQGKSFRKIAEGLKARGVVGKNGKADWSHTTVAHIYRRVSA